MEKYTFKDLACEVLETIERPMSANEIWNLACEKGLDQKLQTSGKTPDQTLSSRLYETIKKPDSPICSVSQDPIKFWLRSRMNELGKNDFSAQIPNAEPYVDSKSQNERDGGYQERDLHPLLVRFVMKNFGVYCKTIYHEESRKQRMGKNQWIHPDIVGVKFPSHYNNETFSMVKNFNQTPYKLYSFELKKNLNFSNLRECYFQAVSNSSWANLGYLVVLKCEENEEFMQELWRLNNAFGIGLIQLNAEKLLSSQILIPAKEKENLDFDTIDLLLSENPNFKDFIASINHNATVSDFKFINDKGYDEILSDEKMEKHIKDKGIN